MKRILIEQFENWGLHLHVINISYDGHRDEWARYRDRVSFISVSGKAHSNNTI